MSEVACVDGSRLDVRPLPVVDRDGMPYEVTLELRRDGDHFGAVGERCGFFLAAVHGRLRAARAARSPESMQWPDADDRFPASSVEGGLRSWATDSSYPDSDAVLRTVSRYLPRDRDLFAFRHRDPDDLGSAGELRCSLHTQKTWMPGLREDGPARGRWKLARRAVLDAWGDGGVGVRAVLTSAELEQWLARFLEECADIGAIYDREEDGSMLRRPAG